MTDIVKQYNQIPSKRIIFEPGNATRYDLLLSKIDGFGYVMTDLNNDKVVTFNPNDQYADGIEVRLVTQGYSRGDAFPMADVLEKVFKEL